MAVADHQGMVRFHLERVPSAQGTLPARLRRRLGAALLLLTVRVFFRSARGLVHLEPEDERRLRVLLLVPVRRP